jgi:hypothetical protein
VSGIYCLIILLLIAVGMLYFVYLFNNTFRPWLVELTPYWLYYIFCITCVVHVIIMPYWCHHALPAFSWTFSYLVVVIIGAPVPYRTSQYSVVWMLVWMLVWMTFYAFSCIYTCPFNCLLNCSLYYILFKMPFYCLLYVSYMYGKYI